MFSVLNAAMGRALPYPEADRLVLGRATFNGNVNPWVAFPDYMDYRDQAGSLQSLATFTGASSLVTVTGADRPEQVDLLYVTPNFFSTLGVNPVLGGTFTIQELPSEGTGQVVISHSFWQSWFGGDPEVVGRRLTVNGGPFTVMGVMPPGFRFFDDADAWTPPWPGSSNPINRRFHNWLVLGRLAPEASLHQARSEVDVISAQLQDAYPDSD
jgi:putative ABC transport system permease protein